MDEFILQMKNITKDFSGVRALDDVTFNVKAGEIHGLIGENGAGKSTLMKILSGVYPTGDYSGEIIYKGKPQHFRTVRDSEAEGIYIVYQELAMVGCLSVYENLFLGHLITKDGFVDWHEMYFQTHKAFERIGLQANPDAPIQTLSVGKQQLVEIAKALLRNVKLLLLDEPTAALTNEEIENLFRILNELKEEGITTIFISHKLNEVMAMCDNITVLRDGRTITTKPAAELTEQEIIRLMVNREIKQRFPKKTNPFQDEVVFEVRDWSVHDPHNPSRKVVDNASFFARKGEVVGISGLMGSGRTELAMSIFGKAYGTGIKGTLYLNGKVTTFDTPGQALAAGICYLTEDRKEQGLVSIFDIKTNISMANLNKIIGDNHLINENEEKRIAERFISSLRIKATNVEQRVLSLSGGNQQKVVLAKSLNTDPQVLLVDEPTRGIDVGAKFEIHSILNEIASDGAAVIVISSEMPELIGICDRIYVMHEGKIKGVFDRENVSPEAIMTLALSSNAEATA